MSKLNLLLLVAMATLWLSGCELPDDLGTSDGTDGGSGHDATLEDYLDSAYSLPIDTELLADSGIHIPDKEAVLAQALDILRALFPGLSEEELLSISVDLTLDEIIELNNELLETRKSAIAFSSSMVSTSWKTVEARDAAYATGETPYPIEVAPVSSAAFYMEATEDISIQLSGIFRDTQPVVITNDNLVISVDGNVQDTTTTCLNQGETVDIVFLLDVTGSMGGVIASVRDTIIRFIDAIETSGLKGTISLISFQDSVGVNISFQELVPDRYTERSPFFKPVPINNPGRVESLRKFVNTLEANAGLDAPENLAGAIDFARNNVIGYTSDGYPNVVGDGIEDPPFTAPFPTLTSDRQVFVAFTDAPFHSDSRNATNSSLTSPFVPRYIQEILSTLNRTGTVVNVSDMAYSDFSVMPTGAPDEAFIDADYWAIQTGGIGEDFAPGYSITDLDLVVAGTEPGLLGISLDKILQSTCHVDFNTSLTVDSQISLTLSEGGETFEQILTPTWL